MPQKWKAVITFASLLRTHSLERIDSVPMTVIRRYAEDVLTFRSRQNYQLISKTLVSFQAMTKLFIVGNRVLFYTFFNVGPFFNDKIM